MKRWYYSLEVNPWTKKELYSEVAFGSLEVVPNLAEEVQTNS